MSSFDAFVLTQGDDGDQRIEWTSLDEADLMDGDVTVDVSHTTINYKDALAGTGKGKSSSAFGVMGRAWARGWTVCVVQFVKSEKWKVGERKLAEHRQIMQALERHDAVGIAVQHQHRHLDLPQVVAEIGGAEGLHAAKRRDLG